MSGRPGDDDRPIVAILAGGRSERMGRDKAAVELEGTTLLDRVIAAASGTECQIWVVGREVPAREVPEGSSVDVVRWVPDPTEHSGPAVALLYTLELAAPRPVLLVACDMPQVTSEALSWLLGQPRGASGVAVRSVHGVEPLFSLYGPGFIEGLRAWLATGRKSLRGAIAECGMMEVVLPERFVGCVDNINTPEDLRRLRATSAVEPS